MTGRACWLDLRAPATARAQHVLGVELRRELASDHPLFGRDFLTVAYCLGCDTVLVEVLTPPPACALVRPTWRCSREAAPAAILFASWSDCLAAVRRHRAGLHV